MKFAQQTQSNGETRIVDATGKPLGNGDADHPILHILPKLFVPSNALNISPHSALSCEKITLTLTTTLPFDIRPEGGIVIRQPYPNKRYFVGGSTLIRNGWIVPLPLDVTEFDVQFSWQFEPSWQVFQADEWEVQHLIHIKLHPGKGMTYSMDSTCWPQLRGPAMLHALVAPLGIEGEDKGDWTKRKIVRHCGLGYERDGHTELAGFFLEENADITGIPLDQAYTIDAFQEEQIHEVKQTDVLKQDNEAHRANGPIEMPSDLFVRAIKLAGEIPFEVESAFAKSVAGVPGGFERHPALQLLCEWWETVRPDGEPFKPGSAMPMVRVRDDGEYWWGDHEVPNSSVVNFNPSGRDVARIGDFLLVLFEATQEVAKFDQEGMHTFLPSGEEYECIGVDKESYLKGEWDDAWTCLRALISFRSRFPAAWKKLEAESPAP